MFSAAPNPIAISLGPLDIRWYGLVYAIGFLFVYFYLRYQAKKKRLHLDEDHIDTFVLYAIVGVIIGGRLGEFIFWTPARIIEDPVSILRIWEGGMAFHGALVGLALAIYFFARKYNVKFYHVSDHLMIPAALFLFFGRIANFINAELVGTVMQQPNAIAVNWFNETNASGDLVYRHPSQLYAAAKNLINFVVLVALQSSESFTRRFKVGSGFYTWLFILMYGLLRTITNYWKEEARWFLGIFSSGQLLSFLMFAIAAYILITKYINKKHKKQ